VAPVQVDARTVPGLAISRSARVVAVLAVAATTALIFPSREVVPVVSTGVGCTFAGRADLLMLLARTGPDRSKAHRGLSLFVGEDPQRAAPPDRGLPQPLTRPRPRIRPTVSASSTTPARVHGVAGEHVRASTEEGERDDVDAAQVLTRALGGEHRSSVAGNRVAGHAEGSVRA
jgi:hypothetical protein